LYFYRDFYSPKAPLPALGLFFLFEEILPFPPSPDVYLSLFFIRFFFISIKSSLTLLGHPSVPCQFLFASPPVSLFTKKEPFPPRSL